MRIGLGLQSADPRSSVSNGLVGLAAGAGGALVAAGGVALVAIGLGSSSVTPPVGAIVAAAGVPNIAAGAAVTAVGLSFASSQFEAALDDAVAACGCGAEDR